MATKRTRKVIALKPRRKVISITRRRREVMDIVKFIDAHGGRLGAFRGYGAGRHASPPPPNTSDSQ